MQAMRAQMQQDAGHGTGAHGATRGGDAAARRGDGDDELAAFDVRCTPH